MTAVEFSASFLSADVSCLGEQIEAALEAGIHGVHVDVMDGHFVPQLAFGPQVVRALRPVVDRWGARMNAHLMVERPEQYLGEFARAGSHGITLHVESTPNLHAALGRVRELGPSVGVAINPGTPLVMLEEVLGEVDWVLVMTVNPGAGRQKLIPSCLPKIVHLRSMLSERGLDHVAVAVDGGVHEATVPDVVRAGARVLVVGSALFVEGVPVAERLRSLRAAAATA